jgi:hypothetical protein
MRIAVAADERTGVADASSETDDVANVGHLPEMESSG